MIRPFRSFCLLVQSIYEALAAAGWLLHGVQHRTKKAATSTQKGAKACQNAELAGVGAGNGRK